MNVILLGTENKQKCKIFPKKNLITILTEVKGSKADSTLLLSYLGYSNYSGDVGNNHCNNNYSI